MNNLEQHIKRCLKENRRSQKAIYEHYTPLLYKWAIRYMYTHHDSEEVVQNAWIAIFKSLSKYKHADKFEAWMKVIVIRLAWNARAQQKKVESLSDFDNKLFYDIESELFDRMTCMEVLKTLEVVPYGSREVFKMYVLEGYKHVEIAKILEISESTSRVHLSKARKLLKNIFVSINYQNDEQKTI